VTVSLVALQVLRGIVAADPTGAHQASVLRASDPDGGSATAGAFLASLALTSACDRCSASASPSSVHVEHQDFALSSLPTSTDELLIRLESLSLAPSYQIDPAISRFFISLKVLGSEFNTNDLVKSSAPPIQVNATFKVPFSRTEHSRTREDLLRAMRFGDRSSADVRVSLCYYESGVGGEEGLELAVGLINLRDIWAQKEDLMHQQVSLLEEGLEETSSITMSSSVIYPLTQLLNP